MALGLLLVVIGLSAPPSRAYAESCFESGEVIVERGEILDCDLTIVPGSLLVKDGGRILGSANVPSGSAQVFGEVGGDIAVVRDLVVAGEVGGNATAILGDVEVSGEVKGDATAGGDLTVTGEVGGDLSAGGHITISDPETVGDAASVTAGGDVLDADGATLDLAQAEDEPVTDMASILLLALAMVVFGAVFAALATAAFPDPVERAREASLRSTALTTFLGLVAGLVLLFTSWLIIPALIGLIALAVGGVGLAERVGGRVAGQRGRIARSAAGAALLSIIAAALLLVGAGHPIRLCLASIPLALLSAAALGPGLVTQFGRRDWREEPEDAALPPMDDGLGHRDDPGDVAIPQDDHEDRPSEPAPVSSEPTRPAQGSEGKPSVELPGGVGAIDAGGSEEASELDSDLDPPTREEAPATASGASSPEPSLSELRRVPGITPIYAELLRSEGIESLSDFAALSPQRLLEIASAPGVLPIDLETAGRWLRSARELTEAE